MATVADISAVITARIGSKRLPRKNLLPIGGKPLFLRSIEHAQSCNLRTIVTTDSEEISQIAKNAGAVVVFRPEELRNGDRHEIAVQHALWVAAPETKWFALLQPSSPFRFDFILKECLRNFYTHEKPVVTVYGGHLGKHEMFDGCVMINRRQDGFAFPNGRIAVPNAWINSLQIDTLSDYDQAVNLSRCFC